MKKLNELYNGYPPIPIKDIKTNSKEIEKGDIFVCTMGVTKDRHNYVEEAIKNGAKAIVASKKISANVPTIYVENTNDELPKLARRFYDHPEKKLDIIAITGTNGKTTTASIIQDLIGNNLCGYMGTNGIICHHFNKKIKNTTPDADKLYKYLRKFKDSNCKFIAMEASSEAFFRDRLKGIIFKIGIITNITEDHLNIHKTVENYVASKQKIINHIQKDGVLILNINDKYYLDTRKKAKNTKVLTFGKGEADLKITDIKEHLDNTEITFKYQNKNYHIISPLLGEFNAYNLAAAILALISLKYDINTILKNIPNIKIPHGRMNFLKFNQNYYIILDYAHTVDAFKKVFSALLPLKKGRIITVTGSAGGREHQKRPSIGKVVLDNSNYVIFTMDDPRWEDVDSIIDDLVSKTNKTNYERIIKREDAIKKALDMAKNDDIVLIAGKGDDNYMAIHDEYIPYSDYHVIKNYFKNL